MFEQTFVSTGNTNKTWTVLLSTFIQLFLIGVFIILPMIYFDVLPAATLTSFLVAPPPPPPPPPPPAATPAPKVVKVIPRQFDAGRLMTPKSIPKQIAEIKEDELPPPTAGVSGVVGGVTGGIAGGNLSGVLGGIIGSAASAAPPPPPPPPKAATPTRIRVGGNVQAANLINGPKPNYPPLAKQARISGTVELSAIIGKDGRVQDLKVIKGHPLLVQSALDAVKNWVYRPTLLNGEPVEVSTTIDVNFTLSN